MVIYVSTSSLFGYRLCGDGESADFKLRLAEEEGVQDVRRVFTVGGDERFLTAIYASFGVVLLLIVCVHF